jgi:hypothetical protein
MRTLARSIRAAVIAAVFAVHSLDAQDSTVTPRTNGITAFTFGVPGYGSESMPYALIVGMHALNLDPGRISGDFAVGVLPLLMSTGVIGFGVRGGFVLPVQASPRSYIVPSTGLSFMGGLGGDGGTVLPGTNVGITFVSGTPRQGGFRVSVTWHRFSDLDGAVWLAELGFFAARKGQ